jgi:uncharacterized protein
LVALKAFPCETQSEMERPLANHAKTAGKVVAGLETLEEQMAALDAIPVTDQLAMLRQSAQHMDSTRAQVAQLMALYAAGNIEALASLTLDYGTAYPGFADALINRRNAQWAAYLRPRLGRSSLGGPQGLLALLRAADFTLTPVMPN